MLTKVNEAILMANKKAKETEKTYAVVEMDYEEGRKSYVVPFSYTNSDEFEAFCGEIIYVTDS